MSNTGKGAETTNETSTGQSRAIQNCKTFHLTHSKWRHSLFSASHCSRSAACPETISTRFSIEEKMEQNPAQGRALPRAEKTGRGAYEERRVWYSSTLWASRMRQIRKRLSFWVSLENISVPEGKKQTYTRTNLQVITNGHLLECFIRRGTLRHHPFDAGSTGLSIIAAWVKSDNFWGICLLILFF